MTTDPSTPLMRQYNAIKQQVPHALLLFRLGDFYELFFEDAILAARELEITLTSRNKEKGAPIPMCGVPYHAAEGYIARLIQKGHRVAICDQMEDPALAKKLVKREITRVVTPGTATDSLALRSHENNYLAAVSRLGHRAGVAHVDVSTGEFRVTEMDASEVNAAIEQLGAREVLYPADLPLLAPKISKARAISAPTSKTGSSASITPTAPCAITSACSRSMDAAWPTGRRPCAPRAPSCITCAKRSAPPSNTSTVPRFTTAPKACCSMRSPCAISNWSSRCSPASAPTPRCCTSSIKPDRHGRPPAAPAPARPSLDRAEIEGRLDAAGELLQQTILRAELRKQLSGILDIERLLAKITMGVANPRDVLALGRSLEKIPTLKATFETQRAARLRDLHERLDEVAEARDRILKPSPTSRPSTWPMAAPSAPASMPISTNCATSAAMAARSSRRSRPASAPAPASNR
jgi:DNA mismatch repair protein MutS